MTKWLRDLASELGPDVSMPQVVPNILGNQQDGAAFWGDVVTVLPWTLYRATATSAFCSTATTA